MVGRAPVERRHQQFCLAAVCWQQQRPKHRLTVGDDPHFANRLGQEIMKRFLHKLLGDRGERAAVRFLKNLGYRIVAKQYDNQFGEIDIIAVDGQQLVFVEVKTRKSTATGEPFEAVDRKKQQKLTKLALSWMKQKRRMNQSARFDVISIVWPDDAAEPEIQHFRNAFEATGTGQFFS